MRRTLIALILLGLTSCLMAQQNKLPSTKKTDSIQIDPLDEAALIYPRIRQLSITHIQTLPGSIRSERGGQPLFNGESMLGRTNINFNLPFIEGRSNSLIGSLGVVHQFTQIDNIENLIPGQTVLETNNYIPMLSLGATFIHRDTLFNHPITFTGSLSGLFNPAFSRRQITFTGLITVPVIQRPYTRLSAGIAVNIDPSSPIPAFLVFSYFHKFKAMDLDLMVDAPYRVAVRKALKTRSSLTLQSEVGGSNSFFEFNSPSLPDKLTYSTLEIKSGLLFEYRLTKKLVFSFSGGALATVTSKIFEQGERPSNYIVKNKQGTVPYGQIGISLLPFWRPFKKKQ